MKKLILLFFVPALLTATAQDKATVKEGKVVYERVIKMQGVFRGPDGDVMDRMPEQLTEHFELLFAGNRSLWQMLPNAAEQAAAVSDMPGNTLRVARWGGADVVYCDFEKGRKVSQSELHAKNYIVEDSIAKLHWKLHDDEKEILGYKVKRATAARYGMRTSMGMENGVLKQEERPDTTIITAWYAPNIPVRAGPDYSGQLPGLILELDEAGGRSVYKAVEISPKLNAASIREPKSGKRISAAGFREAQQKAMAEMRTRMQNGGRVSMPLPPGN